MQFVGLLDDGMTGKTIHELLELPEHVTSPHAYQVFGLNPGESNAAAIQEAIARRITQLKAAKSSTAPETWSRAAQVLQTAQRALTDPKKKAKLDARFGIVSMDDASSTKTASPSVTATPQQASPNDATTNTPAAPVVDPLAALLPTGNTSNNTHAAPVASAQPAARVSNNQPVTEIVDATLAAGPVIDQVHVTPANPATGIGDVTPNLTPTISQSPAPLVVQPRSPTAARARRRQNSGGWLMGGFLLLGFVIVGFLAAFFFWGPGEVQVVRSNDGITIRTKNDNANRQGQPQAPVVEQKEPVRQVRPTSDGIMKQPPPAQPNSRDSLGNFLSNPDALPDTSTMPGLPSGMPSPPETAPAPGMGMGMQSNVDDSMQPNTVQPTPGPEPSPTTTPSPAARPEPTAENIAAGETAIASAEEAIRQPDWSTMKSLAEAAEKAAVTDEQVARAETLYQIADLGTYYRGGVSRAMADRTAGNEFNVTDSIALLVVEASAQQLIARRGARNYTYTLDDLPFVVSKALAKFQLPMESETGQAAQAIYESIASKSTPEVRADAAGILRSFQNVEGADPQRIADWIETRYTPSTSQ
ncbi:MAG TPA: hypothetical protein DDX19_07780 [Rhodopirellula baltica]|uniref:Uncharacterized protein n=2 Tax=Rhodopirellula baltica TaxID=265606 RepID=Q7UQ15_RHOBA|nr:hypothetical protein RB6581 [Rhodopirellula baltica SH 1]HBE62630.1 hypothetical protein [Rhodopirellula baltica]